MATRKTRPWKEIDRRAVGLYLGTSPLGNYANLVYRVTEARKGARVIDTRTVVEPGPTLREMDLNKPDERSLVLALRAISELYFELFNHLEWLREQQVKSKKTVHKKK